MKSILNVKETSNLIKGISSHKICSEIKSQQVPQTCSVPQTLDFSQNYFVPFHRFTCDHSISCVLLIDKPNESCQKLKKKKLKNAIFTTKKAFKKKREQYYTSKDKCPNFINFFRRPKINNYQIRNKELKMKLGQLQDEISKTSLTVSADLCNNFKSIILETDQRKIYPS